jgi:SPP1 family phage portal protein
METMKTHGRKVIYANYTEKELLSGSPEEVGLKVLDILVNSISIHEQNKLETKYLQDYLYGDQDIKYKTKKTRTDINNTSVENWAYAFNDWKKTFLLGKPIQYAPINDVNNEEIIKLNTYNKYEDKEWLDQEIYEDIFTCGRGFRYIYGSPISEDDESPFELINCDATNTEVVYSSSINHEQLLSYIEVSKKYIYTDNEGKKHEKEYEEYNVYTRNTHYVINNKNGDYEIIKDKTKAIILNTHIIVEYYMNRRRMGFLEIAKDLFDDINYVENLDMDDIEAFVNSIMVFTNAEVNKNSMDAIKEYGAVSIKSTEQKKASVELLQSRLKSLDTQIFYLRKLGALHTILSVPQATNNGDVSNAETGKAFLTGQGFTSASIRIDGEEQAFKRCDRNALKVVLKICKNASKSGIKTLKASDIESKFSRDLSDNLLNKTQALLNLTTANIPPEIRNQVIGLFSDPVMVTKMQKAFEEEKRKLQEEMMKQSDNNENKINEQNNQMRKAKENDRQGQ